jgi:DNA-binding LytR/AlgR family response regulator
MMINTIKCIAIDDEPLALTILANYVSKVPFLEMIEMFTNPSEAIIAIQEYQPDILFIDIQMPEIKGTEFIKTLPRKPQVIFTTAYSEYAVEGFNLDAADYLLKPIPFERFIQAVNKAVSYINKNKEENKINPEEKKYIIVKSGYKNVKIYFEEILFIEGLKEYVTIYTNDAKYVKLETFKNLEEILPSSDFLRVHKSYIVNIQKVKSFYGNILNINDKEIPIGRAYKEMTHKYFK